VHQSSKYQSVQRQEQGEIEISCPLLMSILFHLILMSRLNRAYKGFPLTNSFNSLIPVMLYESSVATRISVLLVQTKPYNGNQGKLEFTELEHHFGMQH
jgi:hypothetical protein